MSKKQKKSVEKVEEKVLHCQDCRNRTSGANAQKMGLCGYCGELKTYVPRKHEICDKFKAKKNA